MPVPPAATLAAQTHAQALAAVRARSTSVVDLLVTSISLQAIEDTYMVGEPTAVAMILSAFRAAASRSAQAGTAGVAAWQPTQALLSTVPTVGGLPGPADVATVLRQTVLTETLWRISTGVRPADALEHGRLRGGRATANMGADHARTAYTAPIEQAGMGWARVPSADACPFCLLMASRGPVYRSEQTATGRRGFYHPWDRCRTMCVPDWARPEDYLDGEIGERVAQADKAYYAAERQPGETQAQAYLRGDFAQTQNRDRAKGSSGAGGGRDGGGRGTSTGGSPPNELLKPLDDAYDVEVVVCRPDRRPDVPFPAGRQTKARLDASGRVGTGMEHLRTDQERDAARWLQHGGLALRSVDARAGGDKLKYPDFVFSAFDATLEWKTTSGTPKTVRARLWEGSRQSSRVGIDVRGAGIGRTETIDLLRAELRAYGADLDEVLIRGDGFVLRWWAGRTE